MMSFTQSLQQLSTKDVSIAGGKGASLGEMLQAGIPVPGGFVVNSTAFDNFIETTGLYIQIQNLLDKVDHKVISSVESASERIQDLIMSFPIPQEIEGEIYASFDTEQLEYVAVRSSATAEDGVDHARAGQLESYLNTTKIDLIEKVRKCRASLFTPRAIFYRFEKDLHKDHISVAVVVQKMIQSEVSGIAFSVHPVTEDRNQMIIEAGYGLGEAIVSGTVTPDSYVVRKDNNEIDITVNHQQKALYRSDNGGNEWVELGDKGKEQILTQDQILELSTIILRIEDHYGFPCDIEWAYAGGKFYIVQSRPITTLMCDNKHDTSTWVKTVSRNVSILQWDAQIKIRRSGLQLHNIHWGSKSDLIISHPNLPNPTVFTDITSDKLAYTNFNQFFIKENNDIDIALKEAENIIEKTLLVQPGMNLNDVLTLYEDHKINMGVMVMGYAWAFYLQDIIKKEIGEQKRNSIEKYAMSPYKKTSLLHEYDEIVNALHHAQDLKSNAKELAAKYGYIHAETMSNEYTADDYLELLRSKSNKRVFRSNNDELSLNDDYLNEYHHWLIESLRKIVYIFDEGKIALIKASWAMRKTLTLLGYDEKSVMSLTEEEFYRWVNKDQTLLDKIDLEKRLEYFAIYSHHDKLEYVFGKNDTESIIKRENIHLTDENLGSDSLVISGSPAQKGMVRGVVRVIHRKQQAVLFQEGEVLVTSMTTPELLGAMYKAIAFVTDEGGATCHAAIIARELKIPCIVGTAIATQILKDGDLVEVDADNGVVRILS